MTIHERVISFTHFLTASWRAAEAMQVERTDLSEFMENWEQANWELLVEWALGPKRFLAPLNAADIYDDASRATHPAAMPTDMILCLANGPLRDLFSGHQIDLGTGLEIEYFVSFDGDKAHRMPPFDHVCVRTPNNDLALFRCDDVRFELFPYREL